MLRYRYRERSQQDQKRGSLSMCVPETFITALYQCFYRTGTFFRPRVVIQNHRVALVLMMQQGGILIVLHTIEGEKSES